jgi:hypothetical protein
MELNLWPMRLPHLELERHQFPLSRFPLPPPEAYVEADAELSQASQAEDYETRDRIVYDVVGLARGSYCAFEESLYREQGRAPASAESTFNRYYRPVFQNKVMDRADSTACFAIDAATQSVLYNDEPCLQFVQEHVLGLGSSLRTRADLAAYLHPYQTGALPVMSPEERFAKVLSANDAALFVKQSFLDRHRVRHRVKPFQLGGADVWPLSAIDELTLHESSSFGLRWRIPIDWDEMADYLDDRTARELEQVLSGLSVEEIGKTNYNHFRRQLPQIRKLAFDLQRSGGINFC